MIRKVADIYTAIMCILLTTRHTLQRCAVDQGPAARRPNGPTERRSACRRCDRGTGFSEAAMSLSEYCRRREKECRRAAEVDLKRKEIWLRMAASWSDLADEIKRSALRSKRTARN